MNNPICLKLFKQDILSAFRLARDKAGKSMAARIAMMAITTNSSISVKPPRRRSIMRGMASLRRC
jgi:hypothetical protein